MKKYINAILISLIFCLSFLSLSVKATETEKLEEEYLQTEEPSLNIRQTVLKEGINKNNTIYDFAENFHQGTTFEEGPVEYFKLGILYGDEIGIYKQDNKMLGSNFNLPFLEAYAKTIFRGGKYEMNTMFNFSRDLPGYTNYFSEKITALSLTRNIKGNQKIIIGQDVRLPIGVDGKISSFNNEFVERSQIGRTFGNVRSTGVRYEGNFKYIDYDLGLYDSTRFAQDYFKGLDFAGWVNFKPLASKEKYGKITIGTGCNIGHYNNDYSVLGTYLGYDYKKFHTKFEYSHANGYNGIVSSTNTAEGFYNSFIYDLTKKIHLTARYDYLNPDKNLQQVSNVEYTTGIIYKPAENVRIILNYIFKDSPSGNNQNKFMMSTRFYF